MLYEVSIIPQKLFVMIVIVHYEYLNMKNIAKNKKIKVAQKIKFMAL